MDIRNIDKTHIIVLKDDQGRFERVEMPIERPTQFIAELEAMASNPNRTVWDMQTAFTSRFNRNRGYHDYIHPYSYSTSYVGGIQYPAIQPYDKLNKSWHEAADSAEKNLREEYKNKRQALSQNEIQKNRNNAISNLKRSQKDEFLSAALRWIDASCYAKEVDILKMDSSVKMFSKENVGWNSFTYEVNKDVVAELNTNFGYGSAAYFLLSMKYKDIPIIPYSYIVRYYNANMMDIVRCTRHYGASRESWMPAFDFISEFVNEAASNPDGFVKNYIMNEVVEMMSGLRAISDNPEAFIENIRNNNLPHVINVYSMTSYESNRLAAYPSEIPLLFKVEKITGALNFLKSLKEIAKEVDTIYKYIDQLYELNISLLPEINVGISSINHKIDIHTVRKELLNTRLGELDNALKPYQEEIDKMKGNLKPGEKWNQSAYNSKNPDYVLLRDEKSNVTVELSKLKTLINDLKSFVDVLNKANVKLEELKAAA